MVRKGEIEGQFIPKYYTPERNAFFKCLLTCSTITKLKKIIKSGSYGILPKGDSYDENAPITLIRATELKPDFHIDFDGALKVPAEYYEGTRARLNKGDVLLAVKGATIASAKSVALVERDITNTIINGSIFKIEVNESALPKYLAYVLDLPFAKQQMKYNLIANNAVDYLDKPLINNFLIPLPPLSTQLEIIGLFEVAYASKKQKEAEAAALLASIDGYLLQALGITLPPPSAKQPFFYTHAQKVSGGRFDALSNQTDIFSTFKTGKFSFVAIKDLLRYLKTGFAAGKQDQDLEEIGVIQIRPTNVKEPERDLTFERNVYIKSSEIETRPADLLQRKEVLFNNTNSQELVGKTTLFDLEGNYFCSNHMTRLSVNEKVDPIYLMIILNLYQHLRVFYRMCVNWNNQSGVNAEMLKNIKIPLPPLETQTAIANHISALRAQAKQLQQQAEAELAHAKQQVEKLILGES